MIKWMKNNIPETFAIACALSAATLWIVSATGERSPKEMIVCIFAGTFMLSMALTIVSDKSGTGPK